VRLNSDIKNVLAVKQNENISTRLVDSAKNIISVKYRSSLRSVYILESIKFMGLNI